MRSLREKADKMPLFFEYLTDIQNYLNQGGYIMYPITVISVWMWYLIIKKLNILYHWRKQRMIARTDETQNIMNEFDAQHTCDPEIDKRLFHSLIQKRQNELEHHIQTIFVLASIAPLFGLLGTVAGMISTFDAISCFGNANARALATGIREALITTQIGLIVAVPGLVMGHIIRRSTDNIQMRMERWKLGIRN